MPAKVLVVQIRWHQLTRYVPEFPSANLNLTKSQVTSDIVRGLARCGDPSRSALFLGWDELNKSEFCLGESREIKLSLLRGFQPGTRWEATVGARKPSPRFHPRQRVRSAAPQSRSWDIPQQGASQVPA